MKYLDIPQLNQLARLLSYESSECSVHARIEAYTTKSINKDKKLWKSLEKGYVEEQAGINLALFGSEANAQPSSHSLPRPGSASSGTQTSPTSPVDFVMVEVPSKRAASRVESSPQPPTDSPMSPSNTAEDSASYRPPGHLDKHERKTVFILKATLNAAFPHHDFAGLRVDQFSREKNAATVLGSLSNTLRSVGVKPSSPNGPRGGGGLGPRATTYSAYPGEGRMFEPSLRPTQSENLNVLRELERRSGGEYEAGVIAATHPLLFKILDDVIGLKQGQCDVYMWTPPDWETDPHGDGGDEDSDGDWWNGYASSEDGEGNESDEEVLVETESESDENEMRFSGISIRKPLSVTGSGIPRSMPTSRPAAALKRKPLSCSPVRSRLRLRGSLLWSNHWFFYNKKQKRVLFISIWARSRGFGYSPSSNGVPLQSERFLGWDGAYGAGARAFSRRAGTAVF